MSVLNRFYCLQVKNFFRVGLTEQAIATSPEKLSLWYDIEKMFRDLEHARVRIESMGYQLRSTVSHDETEDNIIYQVRYEHTNGRAIVFEVYVKKIQDLPTGLRLIL